MDASLALMTVCLIAVAGVLVLFYLLAIRFNLNSLRLNLSMPGLSVDVEVANRTSGGI